MLLNNLSEIELLKLHQDITLELKTRGIIRTENILGDYAEHLVCKLLNLTLSVSSSKAIDATDNKGLTYQIKARRLSSNTSVPTIKSLRSFEFDFLILVLFNEDYTVKFCGKLSSDLAKELATPNPRVNGYRLNLSARLLSDKRIEILVLK